MKVAVFSDVQGNLPALQTVAEHIEAWAPELVILNGDLVNRGPYSDRCLRHFQQRREGLGWLPVRGNHEDYVLHCARSRPASAQEADLRRFADWSSRQLGDDLALLEDWPDHLSFERNDQWVHVTHGTLAGNRDGISPNTGDEQLEGKLPEDLALFVTAHTHRPLLREYRGRQILNVGSVGSPFDGDRRASYAQLWHQAGRWHTRIVRLDYDLQQTARDFEESGFLDEAGPLARLIHVEWQRARLLMPHFNREYHAPVLAGEIPLARAVDRFITSL